MSFSSIVSSFYSFIYLFFCTFSLMREIFFGVMSFCSNISLFYHFIFFTLFFFCKMFFCVMSFCSIVSLFFLCFFLSSLIFCKFFFFIKVAVLSHSRRVGCLAYDFKFCKLGLEPYEYKQYLTSKVKRLVQGRPNNIINLTNDSIGKVLKEVCVRQINSEKASRMDRRFKITQKYISEGYLRSIDDTFWKNNEDSRGQQGTVEKKPTWVANYHDNQKTLWTVPCAKSRIRAVDIEKMLKMKMSTVEFCDAIDKVTADIISSDLSTLDKTQLEEVFKLCGFIVRGRTAVDWAVENDFLRKGFDVWKNHVLVVISFAALMVIADIMISRMREGHSPAKSRS